MRDENSFVVEIEELNRRSTVERALDDFLIACLVKDADFESPYEATKELLKRYMAVVRSRNNVRRNWHPQSAYACDAVSLGLIKKDQFKDVIGKLLSKALVVTSNGEKVIREESIQEVANQAAEFAYKSNRTNNTSTELENIVNTIYKWNPDVTGIGVINEMKSTPEKFGISDVDETSFVIRVAQGGGKQNINKTRKFSSVHNILNRIKTTK